MLQPLHRRRCLFQGVATGFASLLGSRLCRAMDHVEARADSQRRFRRCLILWMEGGPSQLDTFDPKPGSARQSIKTAIDGVRFSETLPGLAERADDLCLIRSVGSREGEHERATELLHTGFAPLPSFPRPALGSMVSHTRQDPGFPRYVTLGGSGFGPAFLGDQHAPFVIEDLGTARDQLTRISQKRESLDLLAAMNNRYGHSDVSSAATQRTAQVDSVRRLLGTGFSDALRLDSVAVERRNRYGDQRFGQRLLAAWRLLKLGVPIVEAQLTGWDTHIDNQRRTESLCLQLERPWLALIDDLKSSGMWDDTLIVWMGEFGRTPRLNGARGRDHFPEITPVVLAGGQLGGRVIGETSVDGSQREGTKHSVADLFATLLTLLGLDIETEYTTEFGSPTTVTDQGKPIEAIIA